MAFSFSGVMFLRVIVPAPPCMTSMIFGCCAVAMIGMIAISEARSDFIGVSRDTKHSVLHSCMSRRLLFLAFVAFHALAQTPAANWRTITTAHFRIHYPRQMEAFATRAASRLESVRDAVIAEVGFAPAQITDV